VIPKDSKRTLQTVKEMEASGLSGEEALMAAFEVNAKDVSRVGGS
jgi:glutamate synthase (ferredoxin)